MKTALYIGRFQPFHSGHYSVVADLAAQGFKQICLGIGSAQYQRTSANPLSAVERQRCITEALQVRPVAASISIIAIPDVHDDAAWVDVVDKIVYTVTHHYDVVVTGNAWVERLFRDRGRAIQRITPTISISGSQIRQWIRAGNPAWRQYIATSSINWIEPIIVHSHGPDRTESQNSSTG